ncbi:MAG: DUF2628 domain-containing protein [Oscillospiraceae bacterium]|nr:DUF2628 domain-containing protein [Oscillospiraceae bacterium]
MKDLLMEYYKDQECPVCQEKFKEGDMIVVCPECGTPYHKECYNKQGECINKQRHGEYFYTNSNIESLKKSFERPEIKKDSSKSEIEYIDCPSCGETNNKENKICESCGEPLDSRPKLIWFNSEKIISEEKISGISVKDWFYYLGSGALSYLVKFKAIDKNKYSLTEFNFSAFIFKELYFFYRKMYLAGILFCVLRLFIVAAILTAFLPAGLLQAIQNLVQTTGLLEFFNLQDSEIYSSIIRQYILFFNQNPQVQNYILFSQFVLQVIMGATASRIYRKMSIKKINSIDRKVYMSDADYKNILIKKGSVNSNLVWIIGLILLFLFRI